MNRRYNKFLEAIYLGGDLVLLNASYVAAIYLHFSSFKPLGDQRFFTLLVVINLIWLLFTNFTDYYKFNRSSTFEDITKRFLRLFALQIVLTLTYWAAVKGYYYSREQLLYTYTIFPILNFVWRFILFKLLEWYRSSGYNFRRIIVVGANETGFEFIRFLNTHKEFGYRFLGLFDDYYRDPKRLDSENPNIEGDLDSVYDFGLSNEVDEVFCSLPTNQEDTIKELIKYCDDNMIRFRLVPEFSNFLYRQHNRMHVEYYGALPVLTLRQEPLENTLNNVAKRVFDFFFALFTILLIFTWLIPIIAIGIKLSSPGPVFFRQKRSGENNEIFWCWKFRTMKVNAASDTLQASKDDDRITAIGKILRKTNLDELPQFFNVLLGQMSVVGPRPHMLKHTEEYSKIIDKFMVRHLVKPGITGMAQVKGFRGETRDPRMMEKRVQYDVWYIENWSFLLDIKIVILTVWNMLKGQENAF